MEEQQTQVIEKILCTPRNSTTYYFFINNGRKHIMNKLKLYSFLKDLVPNKFKEFYNMFDRNAPFLVIIPTEDVIELFFNSTEEMQIEKESMIHEKASQVEVFKNQDKDTTDKQIESLAHKPFNFRQFL